MNGTRRKSKWFFIFHHLFFVFIFSEFFFIDGYDDFETADDFLFNKPTPRARQLQKARRTLSKNSYNDSSLTKKEFLHNSNYDTKDQYDDEMEYEETETADTFVEMIDDEDNIIDDNE